MSYSDKLIKYGIYKSLCKRLNITPFRFSDIPWEDHYIELQVEMTERDDFAQFYIKNHGVDAFEIKKEQIFKNFIKK